MLQRCLHNSLRKTHHIKGKILFLKGFNLQIMFAIFFWGGGYLCKDLKHLKHGACEKLKIKSNEYCHHI